MSQSASCRVKPGTISGLVVMMIVLAGCFPNTVESAEVTDESIVMPAQWESALYLDHPLVGRIWSTRSNSFVNLGEFTAAVDSSRYLLLGEKHDNPDHHQLQRNILNYLLVKDKVASLSLEMIDTTADEKLAVLGSQQFSSADELKTYLEWDEQGWDWPFYGPLIFDAWQAGVALLSANISSDQMSAVYREPLADNIATVLDQAAVEQLNAEIDASHCNLLPASQFPAMVKVQQARDHQMALSLSFSEQARSNQIRILVAGNYHVRRDLSVPNYIQALNTSVSAEQILSIAILEVSPEEQDPEPYLEAYSVVAPYDFVWFTPAITNEDYCASLRQ